MEDANELVSINNHLAIKAAVWNNYMERLTSS
jgi:hypothetical protein